MQRTAWSLMNPDMPEMMSGEKSATKKIQTLLNATVDPEMKSIFSVLIIKGCLHPTAYCCPKVNRIHRKLLIDIPRTFRWS
jgi:hypothetical protein